MSIVEVKNVSLLYKNTKYQALKNLNLEIEENKISLLLGPSGSGKSTLSRCLSLLEQSYTGGVYFQGTEIRSLPLRERIALVGFVSQGFDLFKNKTILENCVEPQTMVLRRSRHKSLEKALYLLNDLGLAHVVDKYPQHISGGQKQRVAICRALCLESRLVIMDEPSSALDPVSTAELAQLILKLNKEFKMTFVISTHDMTFAGQVFDQVFYLKNGCLKFNVHRKNIQMKNDSLKQFIASKITAGVL